MRTSKPSLQNDKGLPGHQHKVAILHQVSLQENISVPFGGIRVLQEMRRRFQDVHVVDGTWQPDGPLFVMVIVEYMVLALYAPHVVLPFVVPSATYDVKNVPFLNIVDFTDLFDLFCLLSELFISESSEHILTELHFVSVFGFE